jgi:hypothetical protein
LVGPRASGAGSSESSEGSDRSAESAVRAGALGEEVTFTARDTAVTITSQVGRYMAAFEQRFAGMVSAAVDERVNAAAERLEERSEARHKAVREEAAMQAEADRKEDRRQIEERLELMQTSQDGVQGMLAKILREVRSGSGTAAIAGSDPMVTPRQPRDRRDQDGSRRVEDKSGDEEEGDWGTPAAKRLKTPTKDSERSRNKVRGQGSRRHKADAYARSP